MVAQQVARIKIADCDGRLWGVVAWEAKPGVDTKNPDPNLRSRPTLGMPILLGMTPSKSSNAKTNKWEGQIYNSEDGHTYSASISLVDQRTLRVQGCFLGFLCGGENWTRFEPQDAQAVAPNTAKPSSTRKTTGNPQPPAFRMAGSNSLRGAVDKRQIPDNSPIGSILIPSYHGHEPGRRVASRIRPNSFR